MSTDKGIKPEDVCAKKMKDGEKTNTSTKQKYLVP